MKTFNIRTFSGIETKYDAEDQDRGTLRRAVGVAVGPLSALSTSPTWRHAWGLSNLGAQITTALSGADAAKVHFVIVARGNWRLVVAWDLAAGIARGAWFKQTVNAPGDPAFSATGGVTITATNSSVFRDKTAALQWYGSWVGADLIIGNGVDTNLIYRGTTLAFYGPSSTPSDYSDPARARIPACTAFVADSEGRIYAGGNATNKLRVWFTEKPTATYLTVDGVLNAERSFRDILMAKENAAITGLSYIAGAIVAHMGSRGAIALRDVDRTNDGFKARQVPLQLHAGAANPHCAIDTKSGPFYLGSDFEIYRPRLVTGDGAEQPRDLDLATNRSAGDWNSDADMTSAGASSFAIHDEKNARVWVSLPQTAGGRNALYCYNADAFSITGPFLYPDLVCAAAMYDGLVPGFQVLGISRDGALLYADLSPISDGSLPTYTDPIGTDYSILGSAPTANPGIPYVGVSADGLQFKQVLNGQTISMSSPWSAFAAGDITATRFFKNASLSVIEVRDENFGTPDRFKEFLQVRLEALRNTRAYVGIYAESEGRRSGKWRGSFYPKEEILGGLTLSGRRLTVRIVAVFFNDYPALFRGLGFDFLPTVAA